MKGSPIIATLVTILVLLGMYAGMRALILPESAIAVKSGHGAHDHDHDHGHDHPHDSHAGHDHGAAAEEHDDTALETDFEVRMSSIPKSLTISQPSTGKEILKATEFDSPIWNGDGIVNLTDHYVELQVDVEWETPGALNFVEIVASPARHATRSATLHSEDDISDIAELSW